MLKRITRATRLALLVGAVALLAAVFVAPTLAAGPSPGAPAPLAPDFLRWLVSLPQWVLSPAAGGHGLGLRPAPQDSLAFTPAARAKATRLALEAATPASFDLRTANRVSTVKNQGSFGTCWAFAASGSLESALLPSESVDFSEDNMVLTSGFDVGGDPYNYGGNIWMAAAYLSRWGGPVYEADDKYGDSSTPSGLSPRKHVQEITLVPARSSATDNTAIKNAIQTYGGAYVSMGWYDTSFNASSGAYYYNGSSGTNHGVLVVGWDDAFAASNFGTKPPGDGAFLVKNSWGTSWGLSGYFWVSYYDVNFGRRSEMAVFNGSQTVTNYSGIYQYDPLGDTNDYGFGNSTGWFANVFTAQSNASLSAVGFWALAPGSSYEVWAGSSLTAATLRTSGALATMGFHTVSLPTSLALTAGQQFVVAVNITSPGYSYPIAYEAPISSYASAATAQAGQSYVRSSSTGAWTDFTTLVTKGNVCLKAYVTGSSAPAPGSPTVISFAPTSGAVGTSVTLTGTGFTGTTAVTFNGTAASFGVTDATHIAATVPAGATTGAIAVTNGSGSGISLSSFTVTAPPSLPTVTGLSPTSGAAGTAVTVTGTGFTGATAVQFNGTGAAFSFVSATQITATVPAGATTGPVAVTTPAGQGTSASSFTVTAPPSPPTVSGLSPASGPVGTPVTVAGTGFSGATAVTFNGTVASYSVTDATHIAATVPAGATTGLVAVTTPGGTAASPAGFTVTVSPPVPPSGAVTVSGFSPAMGAIRTTVTITGTGFTGATRVRFNTTAAVFIVSSDTVLKASVPTGATTGPISVTTPSGTAASASSFFVGSSSSIAPTVTGLSPTSGAAGTAVTITGTGFAGATVVAFNGTAATFAVTDATHIAATVPTGSTTGPVAVTTPAGRGTSPSSFTVVTGPPSPPTVSGLSPASGPVGTPVTVAGTGFSGATAVKFNGTVASYSVTDATHIAATVPAGATTGLVAVTTPGGTAASPSSFTVTVSPPVPPPVPPSGAVTVSGFSPTTGKVRTTVTITGTGFTGATRVRFNTTAAVFMVTSATVLKASVPTGATTGLISVTTPGGTASSLALFFVL